MLMPKRVKYRRVQRGRMTGKALRGNKVTYGEFGLQAQEPAWITSNQIEAARVAMTRYTKRGGQVCLRSLACRKRLPVRRCVWPATSFPARRRSSRRKTLRLVVNKMKASEIRSMSAAELESKLVELKKDLFMLRMQHATNHLDNPVKISAVRRDIARVKTVLREKQLEQ